MITLNFNVFLPPNGYKAARRWKLP